MPFSVAVFYLKTGFPDVKKHIAKNIKNVSLQVRTVIRTRGIFLRDCHGRKAFLSASREHEVYGRSGRCRGTRKRPKLGASLTLEAALALSLFIFAAVCMILPMKVLNTERKVQAALESVGEDFSRYAYIKKAAEESKYLSAAGTGDVAKGVCDYLVSGVAQGYALAQIGKHVDTSALRQMTMERTRILEDEEMIDLVLDYEIRFPFPVLGLPALSRTARCSRRAWTGLPGKDYDGEGKRGDEDEIVYVGQNSTRYHRSRSCHYLANKLERVALADLEGKRNQSGSRYASCAVCGSQAGAYVYIMPSGRSYHGSAACRAILAYVRAVRLSEVKHLGACSYCGGS